MMPDEIVSGLLEKHFGGRVYRTHAECAAAISAERRAQQEWEARRTSADRRLGLGPLEGSAEEAARASALRARVIDEIARLLALCRGVQAGSVRDSTLTLEEAIAGEWVLRSLRDRACGYSRAAWWLARQGHTVADILASLDNPES